MSSGWIKLHRQIQEHKLYKEKREFSKFEAWLDLIMSAAFTETTIKINKTNIDLKRGQLATTISFLETRWGWTAKKVRAFIDYLDRENMILKVTTTNKYSVFSIVNYEDFQGKNEQKEGQTKGQAKGQTKGQTETQENQGVADLKGQQKGKQKGKQKGNNNKNIKEYKEVKEELIIIDKIYNHYLIIFKGKYTRYSLTPKRIRILSEILQQGYSLEECITALNNIKLSKWHMGEHPTNNIFKITLEGVFKDADTLESWINYKPGPQIKVIPGGKTDNFNNFDQRQYDFKELEKAALAANDPDNKQPIDITKALKDIRAN